ncbi:MAG TPA: alkyl hydroperoxide reductase [Bacillus bacterium]|nr:alkyl hydroperoxide reductase [Bacillus sp. (in: firmicutes)]
MIKRTIGAGILAGLVLFAIFQAVNKEEAPASVTASKIPSGIEAGQLAPTIKLKNLAGTEVNLGDLKGKKVMLNFWATWCPPCKAEMPAMEQFYKKYSDEVEILAVNLDPQNDVAGFVNEYGLTFPILLDQGGETQHTYSILSIPTTLIIDEEGIIQKKHIGSMTYEQMVEISK